MIREEDDGLWLVFEETIAAHHDLVFHCFTTEDGLTRWFPVSAKVDLQPGGTIVLGWDPKFTRTLTIAILDYDAGGRITWDWYTDRNDAHAPVSWTVEPNVEEGSRVIMRQGPFRDDRESLLAMVDEASSWRWQLCNLRAALEMKYDMRKVRPL